MSSCGLSVRLFLQLAFILGACHAVGLPHGRALARAVAPRAYPA